MAKPAKEIGAAMVAATAVPLALNWTDVIKTRMQGRSVTCTDPEHVSPCHAFVSADHPSSLTTVRCPLSGLHSAGLQRGFSERCAADSGRGRRYCFDGNMLLSTLLQRYHAVPVSAQDFWRCGRLACSRRWDAYSHLLLHNMCAFSPDAQEFVIAACISEPR